ncbi:ABC transporter permease [Chitiniphilus purpureus]|uniref:ABC transporter permease n=1 Tax=Chitiniphilus purpureus TaxID=2981137 RepID=A0ABY6DP53_9NEIS|nr:ABC transporter permease [Chitiniphilus sp. CD1]UXY15458.1 ABC transporter permease [Chitiniphilus sp. CD1]
MQTVLTAFGRLARAELHAKLANRTEFLLIGLGVFATSLATAATLYLLAGQQGSIAGWNRYDLIFLQGFMLLAYSLQSGMFNAQFMLSRWLRDGSYLRTYLRPVHPLLQLALERFHPQGFLVMAFGLGYCVLAVWAGGTAQPWWFWPAFALLWLLAAVTFTAINLMAAASAFWFGEAWPTQSLVGRVTDMARYPLDMLPWLPRQCFMWLPLGALGYWPGRALLHGTPLLPVLGYMLLACAVSVWGAHRLWHAGMRHYEGAGG